MWMRIYVDTSAFLHPAVRNLFEFLKNRQNAFSSESVEIVVLSSVINELEKKTKDSKLCYRAKFVLTTIRQSDYIKVVDVEGDYGSKQFHADYYILNEITKYRMQMNIELISNDKALSSEVAKLAESKAVVSEYHLHTMRLSDYGSAVYGDGNIYSDRQLLYDRFAIDFHYCVFSAMEIIDSQIREVKDTENKIIKQLYVRIRNEEDENDPHELSILEECIEQGVDIYQLQDQIEQYMLIIENERRYGLI
jgi:rRNA-processing protein FCF1